jgi:hypothetical protein
MPFACPHCQQTIDGAMSQEAHRERLKAKDEAAKLLEAEVARLRTDAAEVGTLRSERDRLSSELGALRESGAIESAFGAAGVPSDAAVRDGFRVLHAAAMAGLDEGERVTLAEWVASDAARAHPLLAGHYAAPPAAAGNTSSAPPAGAAPRAPGLSSGRAGAAEPPAAQRPPTATALREYLRSPAYRALPIPQQKQELARLMAETGQAGLFGEGDAFTAIHGPAA